MTDPSAQDFICGENKSVWAGAASSPSSALLSPLIRDTGFTRMAGGGGERPGAQHPGLEFFKGHGSYWPRGDPTREPQTIADTCLWSCSPLGPSSHPHPFPRASSLCRSPRWHPNLFRWPVGNLEANLSLWVCEKAHECEHLALPQGSTQKTVSTETVFAALIEA